MKSRSLGVFVLALGLVSAACDSGEVQLSTTSSLIGGTTTTAVDPTTTTSGLPESTSTTVGGETVTEYEVTVRLSTDNGQVLYILIPPGAYTDVDLENFVSDLFHNNADLWGAEVFDDAAAGDALLIPEAQRTEEQKQVLADHHFISLVGGDTIRFQGPFAEFGEYVIGS